MDIDYNVQLLALDRFIYDTKINPQKIPYMLSALAAMSGPKKHALAEQTISALLYEEEGLRQEIDYCSALERRVEAGDGTKLPSGHVEAAKWARAEMNGTKCQRFQLEEYLTKLNRA